MNFSELVRKSCNVFIVKPFCDSCYWLQLKTSNGICSTYTSPINTFAIYFNLVVNVLNEFVVINDFGKVMSGNKHLIFEYC